MCLHTHTVQRVWVSHVWLWKDSLPNSQNVTFETLQIQLYNSVEINYNAYLIVHFQMSATKYVLLLFLISSVTKIIYCVVLMMVTFSKSGKSEHVSGYTVCLHTILQEYNSWSSIPSLSELITTKHFVFTYLTKLSMMVTWIFRESSSENLSNSSIFDRFRLSACRSPSVNVSSIR